MPEYTGTSIRSNLINTLNNALNGNRKTADVNSIVFNTTADTNAGQRGLAFDSFLTAKVPLSAGVTATDVVMPLGSNHAAAQFRVGDVVHVINTDGVATAARTVTRVTPSNESITLNNNLGGAHPAGAVLVRPRATAAGQAVPGGTSSGAAAGAPLDNMRIASLLDAIENFCGNRDSGNGSTQNGVLCDASLVSNLVVTAAGPGLGTFVNGESLIGATCTFTDGAPTQVALRGQRAKVAAVTVGATVTLTLEQFESAPDADGVRTAITEWATTPNGTDIFFLDLDLSSHNKLAELAQAGGDMTTMVSSILTMHRKLDPGSADPEIPV